MRRKKHKQTRRATNYYRINYGFHEPYKVLLDGNFIHAMRAIKWVSVTRAAPAAARAHCAPPPRPRPLERLRCQGTVARVAAQHVPPPPPGHMP